MLDLVQMRFAQAADVARLTLEHLGGRVIVAAELIVQAYEQGGAVYLFGNGGSAADAQHIAGELVGRFLKERRALRAEALSSNTSVLTALANDYSFEVVFARQLEAAIRPGDVAIGISTSGNSANVVAGLVAARRLGAATVALTGRGGGACAVHADVLLDVPSEQTPRIQEAHILLYHTLCELVEQAVARAEEADVSLGAKVPPDRLQPLQREVWRPS